MIRHIFLLAAFAFLFQANAQKPEPIYGFAIMRKPLPYYKEQAIAWKNEVNKNPKDANAWYNYYRVTKNLIGIDSTDKRTRIEKWEELKKIVEQMAIDVPETYEYNYCKFSLEGNNFEFLSYLKKADELANGRVLHVDYMINWGEIERNIERRDKYCKIWFEAGQASPGFMYYNYNVIAGTKPNAIIFTAGDNDTYPIWVLQSLGFRRDVTVLNFSLLHINTYREKVFKELGIEKWDIGDGKTNHDFNGDEEKRFVEGIIKHVAANKRNYPVYLAVTASGSNCKDYIKPVEENLFITGLTYQYSAEPLDNMAIMKRNYEQVYTLDYIDKPFYLDISADMVSTTHPNYIISMLKLFEHYKLAGETQKMEWIKSKLLTIVKGTDREKEVKKYLEQD
mgnify:CR=1 FL=1